MAEHHIKFPFKRVTDFAGPDEINESYVPGTRLEQGDEYDDAIYVADETGFMVLTEVQRIEPPGFAPRVLYLREWICPDGIRFGRKTLRMMSAAAFDRLRKGYRHTYHLDGEAVHPAKEDAHADL